MATRPFARNTGGAISGTDQFGDIAVGVDPLDYSSQPGGVIWWMGPDEDIEGYVIAKDIPSENGPTPVGNIGTMTFWRSAALTDESFLIMAEEATGQDFADASAAYTWLFANGYWTNFVASGGDVTPDPMDWLDGFISELFAINDLPYPVFSGINVPIDISLSWSVVSGTPDIYYRLNAGLFTLCTSNPFTIQVEDGDSIHFGLLTQDFVASEANFTVTNLSDSNTVLDTFNLEAGGSPP